MISTPRSESVLRVSTLVPANGPGCCAFTSAWPDFSLSANTSGSSVVSCAPAARAKTNMDMNAATARLTRNLLCTPHPLCLPWTEVFYTRERIPRYPKIAESYFEKYNAVHVQSGSWPAPPYHADERAGVPTLEGPRLARKLTSVAGRGYRR